MLRIDNFSFALETARFFVKAKEGKGVGLSKTLAVTLLFLTIHTEHEDYIDRMPTYVPFVRLGICAFKSWKAFFLLLDFLSPYP